MELICSAGQPENAAGCLTSARFIPVDLSTPQRSRGLRGSPCSPPVSGVCTPHLPLGSPEFSCQSPPSGSRLSTKQDVIQPRQNSTRSANHEGILMSGESTGREPNLADVVPLTDKVGDVLQRSVSTCTFGTRFHSSSCSSLADGGWLRGESGNQISAPVTLRSDCGVVAVPGIRMSAPARDADRGPIATTPSIASTVSVSRVVRWPPFVCVSTGPSGLQSPKAVVAQSTQPSLAQSPPYPVQRVGTWSNNYPMHERNARKGSTPMVPHVGVVFPTEVNYQALVTASADAAKVAANAATTAASAAAAAAAAAFACQRFNVATRRDSVVVLTTTTPNTVLYREGCARSISVGSVGKAPLVHRSVSLEPQPLSFTHSSQIVRSASSYFPLTGSPSRQISHRSPQSSRANSPLPAYIPYNNRRLSSSKSMSLRAAEQVEQAEQPEEEPQSQAEGRDVPEVEAATIPFGHVSPPAGAELLVEEIESQSGASVRKESAADAAEVLRRKQLIAEACETLIKAMQRLDVDADASEAHIEPKSGSLLPKAFAGIDADTRHCSRSLGGAPPPKSGIDALRTHRVSSPSLRAGLRSGGRVASPLPQQCDSVLGDRCAFAQSGLLGPVGGSACASKVPGRGEQRRGPGFRSPLRGTSTPYHSPLSRYNSNGSPISSTVPSAAASAAATRTGTPERERGVVPLASLAGGPSTMTAAESKPNLGPVEALRRAIACASEAGLEDTDLLERARASLRLREAREEAARIELRSALTQETSFPGDIERLTLVKDSLTSALISAKALGFSENELHEAELMRRKTHNAIQDAKGQIRVFCRVRPLSSKEIAEGDSEAVRGTDELTLDVPGVGTFAFDGVFTPSDQVQVFEHCKDLVQSAVDGRNVTIFAYGQTGAGKTYTMYGKPDQEGIATRVIGELFSILGPLRERYNVVVTGSMIELYNNSVVDLLSFCRKRTCRQSMRDVAENVSEQEVHDASELRSLLERGIQQRTVAANAMNIESSRSHLIFTIRVQCRNMQRGDVVTGKILLCDLGGSERLKKTEAVGIGKKEAIEINKSLTALGDVIAAITKKQKQVPYRNHKLTQIMQDSLGGTAKTLMFVNCSPARSNLNETLMSLSYAARVRTITNLGSKSCVWAQPPSSVSFFSRMGSRLPSPQPQTPCSQTPMLSPMHSPECSPKRVRCAWREILADSPDTPFFL